MTEIGLSLFVAARDRDCGFHRQGSTSLNLGDHGFVPSVEHQTIIVYGPADASQQSGTVPNGDDVDGPYAEVIFIAETREESDLLNGVHYEVAEKDHFEVLTISRERLLKARELISVKDPQ